MTAMRFAVVLLLVAGCKDKAPTIGDFADQMCACKDAACRDELLPRIYDLMSTMTEEQLAANDKAMKRIEACEKSLLGDKR
jgi:hypothetical protein